MQFGIRATRGSDSIPHHCLTSLVLALRGKSWGPLQSPHGAALSSAFALRAWTWNLSCPVGASEAFPSTYVHRARTPVPRPRQPQRRAFSRLAAVQQIAVTHEDSDNKATSSISGAAPKPPQVPKPVSNDRLKNHPFVRVLDAISNDGHDRADRAMTGAAVHDEHRKATLKEHMQSRQYHKTRWVDVFQLMRASSPPLSESQTRITVMGSRKSHRDLQKHVVRDTNVSRSGGFNTAVGVVKRFSGPDSAIQKVADHASKDQSLSILEPRVSNSPVFDTTPSTRLKHARIKEHEPRPPEFWTPGTFLTRIRSLIANTHPNEAVSAFEHLFGRIAEEHSVASVDAFHCVIEYLHKHRKTSFARRMLQAMDRLQCPPNRDTYNIFISWSAKDMNLDAMKYYLDKLLALPSSPNDATWAALLSASDTTQRKQLVTTHILRLGYFSKDCDARFLAGVIEYSFGEYLDAQGSVEEYVQLLGSSIGDGWVTDSNVRLMVDGLGKRGRMKDAIAFLECLHEQYGLRPNSYHLDTLILHCQRQMALDQAVAIICLATKQWELGVSPSKMVLHQMFRLAAKCRAYNSVKVVWVYATMSGNTDHYMRKHMLGSALASYEPMPSTVTGQWRHSMARVILDRDFPTLPESVKETVDQELSQGHKHSPGEAFGNMLLKALAMDKEWTQTGRRKGSDVAWKRANAIEIPTYRLVAVA